MSSRQRGVLGARTGLNMDWDCAADELDLVLCNTQTDTMHRDTNLMLGGTFEFPSHLIWHDQTPNEYQEAVLGMIEHPSSHLQHGATQNKTESACRETRLDQGKVYPSATVKPSQLCLCRMLSLDNNHLGPSVGGVETGQHDVEASQIDDGNHLPHPSPRASNEQREMVQPSVEPTFVAHGMVGQTNPDQRAFVLQNRKLRNRQSAKRSREKRQHVISELLASIQAIREESEELQLTCVAVAKENIGLKQQLTMIHERAK